MRDREEPERASVLIADDHPRVLREMEALLSSEFDVIGTATDGVSMVAEAVRLRPDVIISDIAMPHLNGIEASREILKGDPEAVIVLLTVHNDPQLVKTALCAGIRGYVHKLTAGDELVPAIHGALSGSIFVSVSCRPPAGN